MDRSRSFRPTLRHSRKQLAKISFGLPEPRWGLCWVTWETMFSEYTAQKIYDLYTVLKETLVNNPNDTNKQP